MPRSKTWPRTNALDLTGRKFGRLTVLGESGRRSAGGHIAWRCVCSCGAETEVFTSNLTSGNTTSCGCYQLEASRKANRRSGVRWRKA